MGGGPHLLAVGFLDEKRASLPDLLAAGKNMDFGTTFGENIFLVGFFSDRRVYLDTLGCVRSFVLLFRIFFLEL